MNGSQNLLKPEIFGKVLDEKKRLNLLEITSITEDNLNLEQLICTDVPKDFSR